MKTITLLASLIVATITNNAFAKMTVKEAMESMKGSYELSEKSRETYFCRKISIDIDLEFVGKKLRVHSLDTNGYLNEYYVNESKSKLIYGTKNKGKTAFITLKEGEFSSGGDGYVGSLLSYHHSKLTFSKDEGSNVLVVKNRGKGFGLLNSSCTDQSFYDSYNETTTCEFIKR